MFGSLLKLAEDIVKTVSAPVEITADLTRLISKPIANAAEAIKDEVKDVIED